MKVGVEGGRSGRLPWTLLSVGTRVEERLLSKIASDGTRTLLVDEV